MKSMHICFLCNEYPPETHGGLGTFTQTIARALVSRGHSVTVVGIYPAGKFPPVDEDQGVLLIRIPHSPVRYTGFLVGGIRIRRALARLDARNRIDAIEGQEISLGVVEDCVRAARIIRMHGGHAFFATTLGRRQRRWRRWQERRSFRHATHLCAVSRFVADTTRQLLDIEERPVEVLPNPIDTDVFKPAAGAPEEEGLILFAGTLTEKKGIRQLLQAMPAIVERVPLARLIAVGRDSRDPDSGDSYAARLRASIPAGLEARISFSGEVDRTRLCALMARASVCVYPSHMEAMPIAWLEAMAMGKAVVGSTAGPGPEVIRDNVCGLLANPHDPASIAQQVTLVLTNADLRRRLGSAARRRVVEEFSVDVLIGRNVDFYESCARENRACGN